MSSHVSDQWVLELQQFNVKFEHIQDRQSMIVDMIFRLRMYGLYQDNKSGEVKLSLEDVAENIIEEIHNIYFAPTMTTYTKVDKMTLDLL